jgi:hypothetical protein
MFDLGPIIHKHAARQHVTGAIRKEDLPVVGAGRLPEIIGGWRVEGHQALLSADCSVEWLIEACNWLRERGIRYRLGAQWMAEHCVSGVNCTLDGYVISIDREGIDQISLFHLIFV